MDREEDCKKIIDRYSPDINKSINSILENIYNAGWDAEAYALYDISTNTNMRGKLPGFFSVTGGPSAYVYTWIEKMSNIDNSIYYSGKKPYNYKMFITYTKGPTSLSFNHTTFKTGETSGVMRVVNIVPDSKYEWSSSDTSVVSLTHDVTTTNYLGQTLTDPIAYYSYEFLVEEDIRDLEVDEFTHSQSA